jgi:adenylate cyclase
MWTQRYDRPLKDIFAVQDEIVGKVVTTLALIFKLKEMNAPHFEKGGPTDNLEAFDDLLRATEHMDRFTKSDNARQRQWIEKAIMLDPGYAPAYSFLAASYMEKVMFRWSDNAAADLKQATELAQKSLALDDSIYSAHEILCHIDWMQRRYEQSVAECERAVALSPNNAHLYESLSIALTVSNRSEEAVHAAEKAMRLDPARPDFYGFFYCCTIR